MARLGVRVMKPGVAGFDLKWDKMSTELRYFGTIYARNGLKFGKWYSLYKRWRDIMSHDFVPIGSNF